MIPSLWNCACHTKHKSKGSPMFHLRSTQVNFIIYNQLYSINQFHYQLQLEIILQLWICKCTGLGGIWIITYKWTLEYCVGVVWVCVSVHFFKNQIYSDPSVIDDSPKWAIESICDVQTSGVVVESKALKMKEWIIFFAIIGYIDVDNGEK